MIAIVSVLLILFVCATLGLLGLIRGNFSETVREGLIRRPWIWTGVWAAAFLLLNAAPLYRLGLPIASVHDELSYLLGADTFARGRWTNPPLPSWENFETLYVQMQPTYASIYPPGSALLLSLSQRLTGHPYWSILGLNTLLAAALPWALRAWLPFPFALLSSVLLMSSIALTYWTHSYWGGSLAALCGTVLLGALGELRHAERRRSTALLALSAVALGFVRPFEGAFLVAGVVAWLALFRRRILLSPLFLGISLAGCALFAYYNFRVTGDPFLHPYWKYIQDYVAKALIDGQEERAIQYRHLEIEYMLSPLGSLPFADRVLRKVFAGLFFFRPLPLVLALAVGLWAAWRQGKLLLGLFLLGLAASTAGAYSLPHYVAPFFGLVAILAGLGLAQIFAWRPAQRALGPGIVLGLLVVSGFATTDALRKMLTSYRDLRFLSRTLGVTEYPPYGLNFPITSGVHTQAAVRKFLTGLPGSHLVFVRYSPSHDPHFEWVYNTAELRDQPVIWARYYTEESRQRLRAAFPGHECWVLDPDVRPYRLEACEPR